MAISAASLRRLDSLLPLVVASPKGGRPRLDDEAALNGILFVLHTGPSPMERGKLGNERHLVTEAGGIALTLYVTGANRHDSVGSESLVDALPAGTGKPGRPRRWPDKLHADMGHDSTRCRACLKLHGIEDRMARRGIEHND